MSNDDYWIATRVTKAREGHPLVTQAVLARIETLLKGEFCARHLSSKEREAVAKALISDMVTLSPKAKRKR